MPKSKVIDLDKLIAKLRSTPAGQQAWDAAQARYRQEANETIKLLRRRIFTFRQTLRVCRGAATEIERQCGEGAEHYDISPNAVEILREVDAALAKPAKKS